MNQPSNIEAERAVLAAILNFKDALGEVADMLAEEHFHDPRHQHIFTAVSMLAIEGEPIDIVTVADQLERSKALKKAGGRSYLADLTAHLASTANIKHHAKIVYDNYVKRMLTVLAQRTIQQCQSGVSANEISAELTDRIFALNPVSKKSQAKWIGDILPETLKQIEENSQKGDGITGLPWRWIDLNEATAGLHPGNLIVIAGSPGMGKTIVGMNICQHLASKKHTCLFISAEMTDKELIMRCIASEGKINGFNLRAGTIDHNDWSKINAISGTMSEWSLIIDDSSAPSLIGIMTVARQIQHKYGLDLICIDRLGLMSLPKGERLDQQIGMITSGLKAMAKDLEIPVILIHQLVKNVGKGKSPRPQLSDLRDSGRIEQDADDVIFVYRPEVFGIDKIPGPQGLLMDTNNLVEIIIAKQRNGPTSTVWLTFLKQNLMFVDYARED